ncbi:MAG: TlpA disulfide reductase family protein [Myxococcota bacterium]|nr:TlpA disulfide reductase family protein [Myxococcota bacterium]
MPLGIFPLLFVTTLTGVLTVGSPARLFTLPAINKEIANELIHHEQVALGDFINPGARVPRQGVVLYFFDKSRGGDNLAILNRIAKRNARQQVQVIGIHSESDNSDNMEAWISELGLVFPVLTDKHSIVSMRYEIQGLPLAVIVDAEGQIVSIGNPTDTELESEINAALATLVGD